MYRLIHRQKCDRKQQLIEQNIHNNFLIVSDSIRKLPKLTVQVEHLKVLHETLD
jgi:hypothetical protein